MLRNSLFTKPLSTFAKRKSIYEEGDFLNTKVKFTTKAAKKHLSPNLALLPLFHKYNFVHLLLFHFWVFISGTSGYDVIKLIVLGKNHSRHKSSYIEPKFVN